MRSSSLFFVPPLLVTLVLVIAVYNSSHQQLDQQDKPFVLCTTSIIKDALVTIAGDRLHIVSLMGPGIDPHTYKARESDSYALARADIILYNGLHLEGKINSLFDTLHRSKRILCISDCLDKNELIFNEGHPDPHIWHDVSLWSKCITYIAEQLALVDPENASYYQTRTDIYLERLRNLDQWVHDCINTIADCQKVLITAHDAFGYFARAYGITVVGLQGISTDAEITTHDMQELIDLIIRRKIKAVFIESALPTRPLKAVQHACAIQGWPIHLGDPLYSDALGDQLSIATTYEDMIKHNCRSIVNSLS